MNIIIYEDLAYKRLLPITWTRPVFGIRCGIDTLIDKVERQYSIQTKEIICREYISEYLIASDDKYKKVIFDDMLDGTLFLNGAAIFTKPISDEPEADTVYTIDGYPSAFYLKQNPNWKDFPDFCDWINSNPFEKMEKEEVHGKIINNLWDIFTINPWAIEHDFDFFNLGDSLSHPLAGAYVVGPKNRLYLNKNVIIEPGVVIDTSSGPVYIDHDCQIRAGSHIEGPCSIGNNTIIHGAQIEPGVTFGPQCRIGGEVGESVFQGYTNKSHAGFIGHSVVGEWVNFGSMTTGSDLKNTYGTVQVNVEGQLVDTGLEKVGAFVGDFVKFGIGTLINTGSNIGTGSNIFGVSGVLSKTISPFSWGDGSESFLYEKFIEVTKRVSKRRGIEISNEYEKLLKTINEMKDQNGV